jgi:hypothetical protein
MTPVEAVLLPRAGQAFWNALLIGQMPPDLISYFEFTAQFLLWLLQ